MFILLFVFCHFLTLNGGAYALMIHRWGPWLSSAFVSYQSEAIAFKWAWQFVVDVIVTVL